MPNPQGSQPNPHCQQNQPIYYRQSSSSSNDAPSEPTVDYSSWSPRSYQALHNTLLKWMPKTKLGQPQLQLIATQSSCLRFDILDCGPTLLAPAHEPQHTLATVDHTPREKIRRICSLINALLPTIPSPVTITPFFSLRSTHCATLTRREHHDSLELVRHGTDESGRTQGGVLKVHLSTLALQYVHPCLTEWAEESQGPTAILQGPTGIALPPPSQPDSFFARTQAHYLNTEPTQSRMERPSAQPPLRILSPTPPRSSSDQHAHSPTQRYEAMPHIIQSVLPVSAVSDSPLPDNQAETQITIHPPRPRSASAPSTKKKDGKQLPTRRSERIQAKAHAAKIPGKAKSQSTKLPFNVQTSLSPLDATTTLAILRASGLQINSRVEQLIDDAIEQDQADAAIQHDNPSTPLHDLVPPLLVPGADMLL